MNKLLFPEEAPTGAHQGSTVTTTAASAASAATEEEDYLLQEMLEYDALVSSSDDLDTKIASGIPVVINPFIQKLLLHAKLSYDVDISGVMVASISQVSFTTWTLQVHPSLWFSDTNIMRIF